MTNDGWNNRIGREVRRGIRYRIYTGSLIFAAGLVAMLAAPWRPLGDGVLTWATLPGIALMVGVWMMGRGLVERWDITRHPNVRGLRRYGDPVTLANVIEDHLRSPGDRVDVGDTTITRLWFLQPTFFGIDVVPVRSIVWAYWMTETHYVHHPFAGAHLRHVFFHTCEGHVLRIYGTDAIEGSNEMIEEAVKFVAIAAPPAIFGYTPELKRMWRKDRQAFLQMAARAGRLQTVEIE